MTMNIHYCSHVKYYTHTVYTQLTLVYIARGKRVYAIIATSKMLNHPGTSLSE